MKVRIIGKHRNGQTGTIIERLPKCGQVKVKMDGATGLDQDMYFKNDEVRPDVYPGDQVRLTQSIVVSPKTVNVQDDTSMIIQRRVLIVKKGAIGTLIEIDTNPKKLTELAVIDFPLGRFNAAWTSVEAV